MESDGVEHFVDLESDDCSSCNECDDLREDRYISEDRYKTLLCEKKYKGKNRLDN